jgi:hypothetical protein
VNIGSCQESKSIVFYNVPYALASTATAGEMA